MNDRTPGFGAALKALVEAGTRGDPESPLLWTTKSLRKLATTLTDQGFPVSFKQVGIELKKLGYTLQGTRKTKEGGKHPDRDAQFRRIHDAMQTLMKAGEPVISVDAKKKELIGDFGQNGQEWQPKGKPVEVRVYDFVDKKLGKATPYGVYDVAHNKGWVSVGISADTGEFATGTIERWWEKMGNEAHPGATQLLIIADGGGSNGSRLRLWKLGLQVLADEIGIPITVMHLPPGTSKWNKIEHRMFSFISMQFRGRPLESAELVVELIAHTKTSTGLEIQAELDETTYERGIKVTKKMMESINIRRHDFHGEWNYTISPNSAQLRH